MLIWWSWEDVMLEEFQAFWGTIINMGVNVKSELDDFFSNGWVDYQPFFKFSLKKGFPTFSGIFMLVHPLLGQFMEH